MAKLLSGVLLSLMVLGCAAMFKTSHQLFGDAMDDYVSVNLTIDELKEYHIAADEYFVEKKPVGDGSFKYHYAHATIWPQRYCYYYFLVDGQSKKVKGWGFDFDKGNPRKDCGMSG